MRKYWWIILGLTVLLFTGCASEDSSDDLPEEDLIMPIYLSIAAETPMPDGRALGDPGEGDGLKLPTYLYVFFVEQLVNLSNETELLNKAALDRMDERLDPDAWVYNSLLKRYEYKSNLAMYLSRKAIAPTQPDGTGSRVYAITSSEELHFTAPTENSNPATLLENVENTKLVLADNPNLDLLNVYANPKGDVDNGKVLKRGKFLYETNVTCYHVAARVDIQWDVNPEKHAQHWLTEINVTDLAEEGFFFKHTGNTAGAGVKTITTHPGNQWYGRYVFHTFDTKSVNCSYKVNGVTDPLTQTYVPGEGQGVAQEVFANWYRIKASFGYPNPQP